MLSLYRPGGVATSIIQTSEAAGGMSGKAGVLAAHNNVLELTKRPLVMSDLSELALKGIQATMSSLTPEEIAGLSPPEEVSDLAVFLCTPAGAGVNGQNIVLDRGYRESVLPGSGVPHAVAPEPF
jgi:NAD(P)-dependent dehydrogenase (short-subunit alcohol dehydrogenase family)